MIHPTRILAIGDVHGCARALDALLRVVRPTGDDLVVASGDYVDRGLDSRGVVDQFIALDRGVPLVTLRGNHEEMMLDAREDPAAVELWLGCGGADTLISYSPLLDEGRLADVPDEHWAFLERTVDYHETAGHIFVHGGVRPDLSLDQQPPSVLRWQDLSLAAERHCSGKTVVCGHTPQKDGRPKNLDHTICIDTHAHADGGWLTCLDVLSGTYWQANERGGCRDGRL